MTAKALYIIFACILLSSKAYCQKTPVEISDMFFAKYKTDSISNALDNLFKTNHFASESKDEIENLKNQLSQSHSQYGRYFGYELLSTKKAGHNIILLTFVALHERGPLFFKILFYKAELAWAVQSFIFDDKILDELTD
jgi:hypothetical protein